jgi:hypothetical protein
VAASSVARSNPPTWHISVKQKIASRFRKPWQKTVLHPSEKSKHSLLGVFLSVGSYVSKMAKKCLRLRRGHQFAGGDQHVDCPVFSEDLTHASLSCRNVSCSSQFVLEYWTSSVVLHCPCFGQAVLSCSPADSVLCDVLSALHHAGHSRPLRLAMNTAHWLDITRENGDIYSALSGHDRESSMSTPDMVQVYIIETLDTSPE